MSGKEQKLPTALFFLNGFLSSCTGTVVCHPIDLVKANQQNTLKGGKSIVGQGLQILRESGVKGLFRGVSAAIMRQATYSLPRIGLYDFIKPKLSPGKRDPAWYIKMPLSLVTGAFGAMCGCPADVSNVRMQCDLLLKPENRRNYKNVIDAFIRIAREEGLKSLWSGVGPMMARGAVVTLGQLAFYDVTKEGFLDYTSLEDGIAVQFLSSSVAGLVTTILANPVDVVKSRLQQYPKDFRGVGHCIAKTWKTQGFFAFYKGFVASSARLGPQTIITMMMKEQLTKLGIWAFNEN